MPTLAAFSTPGKVQDPDPSEWNDLVQGVVAPFAQKFQQFYDPIEEDTPSDAQVVTLWWQAFPLRIIREGHSFARRWERADGSRDQQDEYCEWSVERDAGGKITRVTFTTEVPEYWDHLARADQDELLRLYQTLVSAEVTLDDLMDGGVYNPLNRWNIATNGPIAHLVQDSNTLGAAVRLVAEATILRADAAGNRITSRFELVECGGLGDPRRGSDPQIAHVVNDAAASGAEITFEDPIGLYLEPIQTGGMETPDGADPSEFWKVERGTASHCLRGSFAVPDHLGYTVSDITLAGSPIVFGAQLADRVLVRVNAIVKPAGHQPQPEQCV